MGAKLIKKMLKFKNYFILYCMFLILLYLDLKFLHLAMLNNRFLKTLHQIIIGLLSLLNLQLEHCRFSFASVIFFLQFSIKNILTK
jgi:hypothetical protein